MMDFPNDFVLLSVSVIWAAACRKGAYDVGRQQMLRPACTDVQSGQSLGCSHAPLY